MKLLAKATGIAAAAALSVSALTAPAAAAEANTPSGLAPGQAHMGWNEPGAATKRIAVTPAATTKAVAKVDGMDVSGWQGNVNWASWWNAGMRFAYVKATEGTSYRNNFFAQQYNGSYNAGFIRGAYHFALPNNSGGAAQANYFVDHGGGWSRDGKTLPGVLDIEFNPYSGGTCYGLSQASMRSWIAAFTAQYKARTGRDAVIYTNTSWWNQCVGSAPQFGSANPLWVANYTTMTPPLPAGWNYYTFHQYTSTPLDKNKFNGAYDRLQALANG